MAYPPYLSRLASFLQDANAGLDSPDPSKVDAELNQLVQDINLVVGFLRGVTNADGTLRNQSAATAQALAGAERFVATASQTTFDTAITYSAAFTSLNVEVYASGVRIDSSSVTVSNNAGSLRVVIPAQAASTIVLVAANESGAGILTRLQTTGSATDGANLVGIRDLAGYFTATTVEGALAEEAAARVALTSAVGSTADLIRRTGTVAFTANQSMGGFKLTNLADGTSAQDAVTVNQLSAYTAVWNALQSYFMRLDGTTPMAAALSMGTHKITDVTDGVAVTDAATVGQLNGKLSLSGGTMTGAIAMGTQLITGLAPGVSGTDAVNKNQLDAVSSASGGFKNLGADYKTAGLNNYVVPAGVTSILIEAWGGGGGGTTGAAPSGGGGGAAAVRTIQTVTPGATLNCTVGAGGAAGSGGTDSTVVAGASTLCTAKAGSSQVAASGGAGGVGSTFAGSMGMAFDGATGNPGLALSSSTFGNGGNAAMGGGPGGWWGAGGVPGGPGVAPGGGGAGNQVGAAGRIIIRY